MDQREHLENEFRNKKREYEEQEEALLLKRDKGIQDLEEIAERAYYYLKDYVADPTFMTQTLHQLDGMKEAIWETAQQDKRQLSRKLEDLEDNYVREKRKLADQEFSKEMSDFKC